MKTGICRISAAAILGTALLGPAVAQAQTQITYMDLGPERIAFNEEIVRQFEAANPDIKVNYIWQANEPYKTGIKVMLDSNSPPDVFFNWAGTTVFDFVDAGVVRDLSESETRGDGWTRDMPMSITDQFRNPEGLWGIPTRIYTKAFWKNDSFFADNGLEAPETFDELLGLCSKVREIDPQMTPIAFGASESWTINHYLTVLFQRHVDPARIAADHRLQGDAEALYTDPGYLEALKDFQEMVDADCFNAGINSVTPEVSRAMFASDLAAMTFCGSWCPPQFDEQGFEGRYSPFHFPAIEGAGGVQDGILVGASGYQISAASKYPEESMRFLSFMNEPEQQALMVEMVGQLPANGSMVPEDLLGAANTRLLQMIAESSVSSPPLNTVMETTVSDVTLKSGQDLVNGTITPEDFMQRVRDAAVKAARP
ncbi:ABC transporter substrate-binding protein [Oceaniglobus trochenteri]|uniref:ABC transporter substrate-binding protein n=1 Tax=Oceaniglobus trochenteri TaxID=2763260 RepID=UPI001CFFA340|nr:extracellular solute-binding protein [Oceaniglobus trochenteri]